MSLSVKGITKSFGSHKAVDNMSFEMPGPGVFGLIGTNGAGKTTAIRCILGIMPADGGSATWNGTVISRESLSFGYMPEERGIYMKTKVLDQLVYFAMLRGMNKTDAKKNSLRYLDRLEVSEYAEVPAERLSKGNQQKIQIISALVHDPVLIFLDEPFSGLDPVNATVLKNLLDELAEEKRYIVMSSHQMNTVEDHCEDILILHKGKTLQSGGLRAIKKSFGYTKLIIERSEAAEREAGALGLTLTAKRTGELEYAINGSELPIKLLKALTESGNPPLKFLIDEPDLNEIFIKSVAASDL